MEATALPDPVPSLPVPSVPGYQLLERLGSGASSVVWRGARCADGAAVAVKLVTTRGDDDRVVREFDVLRRLSVEGLVRVHEAFSLPEEPAVVAVVLDLVRGGSLAAVLRARGHLSAGEAVTVVTPVARALADLHALGIVHADVSPGNVLLERTGRPLLADLGVARLAGEMPAAVFGTPGFTAPEVEAGEQPTSASDVYAVGALAWACVTGEPPAPLGVRRPLAELAPGLPQAWLDVVGQCLSSLPPERPSAAEVALRLFDSAPCEPLRLVHGDDEISLITHRLRAARPATDVSDESDAQDSPGRVRTRLRRWPRTRWPAPQGSSARWPGHPAPSVVWRGRPAPWLLVPLGVLLCVALLVPAAVLGGRAWGWPDRAQAAESGGAASSPPTSTAPSRTTNARSQSTTTATTPPATRESTRVAAVVRDRVSPRARPGALMQALADTRAAVLSAGDDRALPGLDVPGSAAWQADARLLSELRERGERYDGLRFDVRSAEPVSIDGEGAALRVEVDTASHDVVGPGSVRTPRPAVRGTPLVVQLRWAEGRWRVEGIATAT